MRGLVALSAATEVVLSPLFSLSVVLVCGVGLVAAGSAAPIDLLAFAVLAPGLTAPFLTLAYSQNDMMMAKKAAGRITELLDAPALPGPRATRQPSGTRVVYEAVGFDDDSPPPTPEQVAAAWDRERVLLRQRPESIHDQRGVRVGCRYRRLLRGQPGGKCLRTDLVADGFAQRVELAPLPLGELVEKLTYIANQWDGLLVWLNLEGETCGAPPNQAQPPACPMSTDHHARIASAFHYCNGRR